MSHDFQNNVSNNVINQSLANDSNVEVDDSQRRSDRCGQHWIPYIMLVLSALLLVIILIANTKTYAHQSNDNICLTADCIKEAARILRTIDESVSPCDDFHKFVCGKWIENTVIPEHKSSQSTFDDLQDELNRKLRGITDGSVTFHIFVSTVLIEEKSVNNEKKSFVNKIRDLYYSCMNTTQIEAKGDKPLLDLLRQFGGWPVLESEWKESTFDWFEAYVRLRRIGLNENTLFATFVDIDDKNSSKRLDQPSFGLFDRDLLLKGLNDSSVAAYYELMVKSAVLLGADQSRAQKQMMEVLEFETLLANYSLAKEERRNMSLLYNKMTAQEVRQMAPNTDWLSLINNFTLDPIEESEPIVVIDTKYIKSLDLLLPQTKKRILSNYLLWRIVFSKITSLSNKWRTLEAEYESRVMGKKRLEPRWEQCVDVVESGLGIGLSHLYVTKYFADENKKMTLEIIENIKTEFKKILNEIDWMKPQTRDHALEKLMNMEMKIGYPEELLDERKIINHYRNLHYSPENYFQNRINTYKWLTDYQFGKLREINFKNDWRKYAEVTEVNAYYYPQENAIVIPAGILQGVFFNKNRPNYLNYGTIGEVAGHELTHGFDDTGRQFDKEGQVNNWWDSATDQMFKAKTQCVIDQYNNFTISEIDMNLNGINTQGENVADNGAVKQAFRAYKAFVDNYGTEKPLPGLKYNPDQLFWISYGIQSCSKESIEYLKLLIETDAHSPSKYRILGTLSNSKDFAQSFNCPIGSPMNPRDKCSVW